MSERRKSDNIRIPDKASTQLTLGESSSKKRLEDHTRTFDSLACDRRGCVIFFSIHKTKRQASCLIAQTVEQSVLCSAVRAQVQTFDASSAEQHSGCLGEDACIARHGEGACREIPSTLKYSTEEDMCIEDVEADAELPGGCQGESAPGEQSDSGLSESIP